MSDKETTTVLKSILCDISNTQRIIDKSKELHDRLKGDLNERETKQAIFKTRHIIDELTNEVLEISATFNNIYDVELEEEENLDIHFNKTCDKLSSTERNCKEDLLNGHLSTDDEKVISSSQEKEVLHEDDNCSINEITTTEIVQKNNEDGKVNDNRKDNQTDSNKESKNGQNKKLDGNDEKENSPIIQSVKQESKAWLRCVDISKLVDSGSTNNSNNNNTSVIVLSDSDSNSTPYKLPTRQVNKKRLTVDLKTPTKGVLKTPTSMSPNSRKKKSVTFRDPETSDIEDITNTVVPETTPKKLPPRKSRAVEFHDISSLSEDSSDSSSIEEITQTPKRQQTPKRLRGKRIVSPVPNKLHTKFDKKFLQNCYVKLAKIHPDLLKRNYEKLLLKNEVKRLTDMHSLKRTRKQRHNSSSSDSSSASERERKRSRTEKKGSKPRKEPEQMDISTSSDSDVTDTVASAEPLNAGDLTKDLITNVDPITHEDSNCSVLEETNLDLLESLGNDSQDVSSSESSSDGDGGNGAKKKKVAEQEGKKEEADTSTQNLPATTQENNELPDTGKLEDKTREEESKKKPNDEKSKWRKDKLLTASLSSSSDCEDDQGLSTKNKEKELKGTDKNLKDKDSINDDTEDKEHKKTDQPNVAEGDKKKENNEAEESNVAVRNKNSDSGNNSIDETKCKSSKKNKVPTQREGDEENKDESGDESNTEETSGEKEKNASSKNNDSSDDSDEITSKKKTLLKKKNADDSDSDNTFAKFLEKSNKLQEKSDADSGTSPKKAAKRLMKKKRRAIVNSDSDSSSTENKKSDLSEKESSESSSCSESDKEEKSEQPTRRRRIKSVNDSSDEDQDKSTRKQIRKVWAKDSLAETTIAAEKEEAERKARVLEKQKKYNQIFEPDSLEKSTVDKVVLDFEEEKELLVVHKDIVKHLKPHQAKGIQFMWNTCFESVERAQKDKGSGCILAHCMGLGKTLQVVTLTHTLLSNTEKTKVEKVLVVCPLSTVLNWVAEFTKWLPKDDEVNVFDIVSFKQNRERLYQVKEWNRCGGVLVLGYDMFRNLTNSTGKRMNKKMREEFHKYLVDPGPDLVVCDEGHLLKNEKTSISIAMNRLKTARRIVLTGTPLQNNLKEYWCMVQFVKPNLLGTYKEYLNRFVNPIVNGQYTDSTQHDIQIMRKRSHVLHKLLDGVVQRRDYAVLAPFLPPKHEYVLFVALTDKQIQLYGHYMQEKARKPQETTGRNSFLFVDFQELQRICTHPRVLLDKSIENKIARDKKELEDEESEGSLKDFIDDDESEKSDSTNSSSSSGSGSDSDSTASNKKSKAKGRRVTRAAVAQGGTISDSEEEEEVTTERDPLEWWREFVTDEDLDNIQISGKLTLLFEILRHCESIGDKVLIFSQSLYSLNVIEYFLSKIDDATQNSPTNEFCGFSGSWSLGLDYFRLDGSSSCDNRAAWCNTFNNPENVRARLFLISTRAGGLGINLVAANRVIIFDVSWNPSHDTQSIYRVYRFGQNKPSYIYRFVCLGTMEMKIYERQVIKQAISKRVIDEQQIDRHYNQNDIAELYKFEPKPEGERPIPLVPADVLLGELLQQDHKIYKYHEHQSLLENKVDEVLDEEERKAAWEEFENEKKARQYSGAINHIPIQSIVKALTSIMTRETPALTPQMISGIIPNMLQELQVKMAAGDSTLYNKVLNEIRLMQANVQQQRIEEYYRLQQQQQQQQNMLLQQYQQQLMANPSAAAELMKQWNQQQALASMLSGISNQRGRGRPPQQPRMPILPNVQQMESHQTSSAEVIDLND